MTPKSALLSARGVRSLLTAAAATAALVVFMAAAHSGSAGAQVMPWASRQLPDGRIVGGRLVTANDAEYGGLYGFFASSG